MKRFLYTFLLLACCCLIQPAWAQLSKPNYWNEIQAFKQQDATTPPPKDAILFVGSSSIRMWKELDESFPEHRVLNRGFGGSTLVDLKGYVDDIVLPYQPKQIIIYSGENDIATGKVSARELLNRFDEVFTAIRKEMPQVPIAFVSMKPSPSRERFTPLLAEANALVKDYLKSKPNTQYIDVFSLMLDENGRPRADLFIEDMLHMNASGYEIWIKAIAPVLISE